VTETHFDTIVVGSGFGGAVTAFRLAEGGQRVCLLERGKDYPPNSFARRPHEMAHNFWDPSRGYQGLFDVWSFRGIEALISSGLGGGSLIYANVLLRKDERWFVNEQPFGKGYETWPVNRAQLDCHYDAVEKMMGATRFPFGQPGYDSPKTAAMRDAAATMGAEWALPPLAVSFSRRPGEAPVQAEPIDEPYYGNLHGKTRTTCRLCGECDLGCNYGSKNTLDHTYLSAARFHGAEIRIRSEVKRLDRLPGGGYSVSYVEHKPENEGVAVNTSKLPQTTITADRLVLAAGTLGSPYLLLKNRAAFPALSRALGTRFCGNGDLLSFVINATSEDSGRTTPRIVDGSRGPVITSYIRTKDEVDGGPPGMRGYYVEDAGYPAWLDWVVETAALPKTIARIIRFSGRRLKHYVTRRPESDLSAEIGYLIGPCVLSSTSFPLLGMGRDVPDGVMKLRKGYLEIDWSTKTSQEYFDNVRATMRGIADALGADFKDNFLWWLKRVITVHPLGGCPMGRHEGEGVVDEWGQAFNYPGLYVADGSVMPGPTGPNPSLTIAAFADRMATRILETPAPARTRPATAGVASNGEVDGAVTSFQRPAEPEPAAQEGTDPTMTALEFTEEMKGYLTFGKTDYAEGFKQGKKDRNFFMFHLTIEIADVDSFVDDPMKQATAKGWVSCEALGGQRQVESGIFNLFVDTEDPDLKRMLYRLFFTDGSGHPLTMSGFKLVKDDPGLDLWEDTTTLYVRLLAGHADTEAAGTAEVVAAGKIHIYLKDFAKQLTTFRTHGGGVGARAGAMAKFGKLFLGDLWDVYGGRASESAIT